MMTITKMSLILGIISVSDAVNTSFNSGRGSLHKGLNVHKGFNVHKQGFKHA